MFVLQNNTGQAGGTVGLDLNVQKAWDMGYTGKGVTVAIMDDGIDYLHPDLRDNYVSLILLLILCVASFSDFVIIPHTRKDAEIIFALKSNVAFNLTRVLARYTVHKSHRVIQNDHLSPNKTSQTTINTGRCGFVSIHLYDFS